MVISGYADEEAGYFGPKSVAELRKQYASSTQMLIEEPLENFANYNHRHASELYKIILAYGDLQVDPDSDSDTIQDLQKLLQELGEYNGNIDGQYKSVERNLIDLQKKIGLIQKDDDWGAGYFGNKTKTALWLYYEKYDDSIVINHTLSNSEKQKINTALAAIRKKLKAQELKGGKKVSIRLASLRDQIDSALPKVDDKQLKAKLIYLRESL